jgi:lysophospholipase L1-like esterase
VRAANTGRALVLRLVLVLGSLLVAFAILELAAYLLHLAPPASPEVDTAIVLYYTDPNGPVKLTPNWEGYVGFVKTRINEKGFRDRVFGPYPPPKMVRIAVLGDSYTMGDAVTLEASYPKQLEKLLNGDQPIEVMNNGLSSTNTSNQLYALQDVLRDYHPDLVVLGYNVNDFEWYSETRFEKFARFGYDFEVKPDGRVVRRMSNLQRVKLWMRVHSYLYRWLAMLREGQFAQPSLQTEAEAKAQVRKWVDSEGPAKSFAALAEMATLCQAQDVPFVVAILPALVDTSPSLKSMDDYPFGAEHTMMHEQMTKLGLDWIDLLPDFAGEDTVKLEAHPFDRHYNERGNGIIARSLKKYLEPKIEVLRARKRGSVDGNNQRRILNPVMTLTRSPDFDDASAKFSGTFSAPERTVMPAATTRAVPTGVTFGPMPNSAPPAVRMPTSQFSEGSATPCSRPEISGTHSISAVTPSLLVYRRRSNCQPNWETT